MTDRDQQIQALLDGEGQPISHGEDLDIYQQLYQALSTPEADELGESFTDHVMQEIMIHELLRQQQFSWLPGLLLALAAMLVAVPGVMFNAQLETSTLDLTASSAFFTQVVQLLQTATPALIGLMVVVGMVALDNLLKQVRSHSTVPL